MQYFQEYQYPIRHPQWLDADAAIKKIHKGQRILLGAGCGVPSHLVQALIRNAELFRDNEIVHLLATGEAPYVRPEYAFAFRHNAFFIGHNVRDAVARGQADYIPVFLSEVPQLIKTRQLAVHAAVVQVSTPNERNEVSLGVEVSILPAAIATADIVIAQVNSQMPFTLGKAVLPLSAFDYLVRYDEPLKEFPQGEPDAVSEQIGSHLAKFIRDGDTLQLGIGNIPDSVLKNLKNKNDLGIHTEMISDGVTELYLNGNITNKKKGINVGASVLSFVLATKKTYDVINRNVDFQFFPSEYTNDPFVICQNQNMVSINSAIAVDLTGQVCSDSLGPVFYSGFGGQVDFVRGAKRSPGGRSFLAFASTAKNGTISKIATHLEPGAGVVTSRADVHYIVTEYGIAYLHGKNIRERALALIQIAHPKFRDELLSYLKQKHYVYIDQMTIKDDHSPVKELIPYSKNFKDRTVYFRELRPHDEKAIQDFFYSHRPQTIYQRYLSYVDALPHAVAQARVSVDYNQDMAIAGFDSWQPYAQMVALGRYVRQPDGSAEIGLVVKEDYQGFGIGGFLCDILLKAATTQKIQKLYAHVLKNNVLMLSIFKRRGFSISSSDKVDGFYVEWAPEL